MRNAQIKAHTNGKRGERKLADMIFKSPKSLFLATTGMLSKQKLSASPFVIPVKLQRKLPV